MQYAIEHKERNIKSPDTKIATVPVDTVHCRSQLYSCSKIQAVDLRMDTALDLGRAVQPTGDSTIARLNQTNLQDQRMYVNAYTRNYRSIITILRKSDSDIYNSILNESTS